MGCRRRAMCGSASNPSQRIRPQPWFRKMVHSGGRDGRVVIEFRYLVCLVQTYPFYYIVANRPSTLSPTLYNRLCRCCTAAFGAGIGQDPTTRGTRTASVVRTEYRSAFYNATTQHPVQCANFVYSRTQYSQIVLQLPARCQDFGNPRHPRS